MFRTVSGLARDIRAPTVVGETATCMVLYEASIPNMPNPPQQGIDSFHLLLQEGQWKITSVVNELVMEGVVIPPELKK